MEPFGHQIRCYVAASRCGDDYLQEPYKACKEKGTMNTTKSGNPGRKPDQREKQLGNKVIFQQDNETYRKTCREMVDIKPNVLEWQS